MKVTKIATRLSRTFSLYSGNLVTHYPLCGPQLVRNDICYILVHSLFTNIFHGKCSKIELHNFFMSIPLALDQVGRMPRCAIIQASVRMETVLAQHIRRSGSVDCLFLLKIFVLINVYFY